MNQDEIDAEAKRIIAAGEAPLYRGEPDLTMARIMASRRLRGLPTSKENPYGFPALMRFDLKEGRYTNYES